MSNNEQIKINNRPYQVVQRIEEQDAGLVWVTVCSDQMPRDILLFWRATEQHGYQASN